MTVQIKSGDLLKEKSNAIVNTVNCVGVIGKRENVTVMGVANITLPPKATGDWKLTSPEARK